MDEASSAPHHKTSHSPNQGVAHLLSHPFNKAPFFLQRGIMMGAIHRRQMVTTDASLTGWGAFFERGLACGVWTGEFLSCHINCLELRPVFLSLINFLPFLKGCHVIVRTENMAVLSHVNRQGGSRSRTLNRHARRLLFWSQNKFLSLRRGSCSRSLEPRSRFSVETEAQVRGMDVEPSNSRSNLGFVR